MGGLWGTLYPLQLQRASYDPTSKQPSQKCGSVLMLDIPLPKEQGPSKKASNLGSPHAQPDEAFHPLGVRGRKLGGAGNLVLL